MYSKQRDTDILILNKLDDRDLFRACSASTGTNKLCNETFFYNRFLLKHPGAIKSKPENITWRNYYLKEAQYVDKLKRIFNFQYTNKSNASAEEYYNILISKEEIDYTYIGWKLLQTAEKNLLDLTIYLVKQSPRFLKRAFKSAIDANNMEMYSALVQEFGEPSMNVTLLVAAATAGNVKLVDHFISKGTNPRYAQIAAKGQPELRAYIANKYL